MNRVAPLLVAVAVVLAGCSFGGGTTTTAPEPVTPADGTPSTETPITPAAPTGPQGIGEERVNETALVFGHLETLETRSYRLTLNRTGVRNDSFRQWTSPGQVPLRTHIVKPSATARGYYVSMDAVGMDRTGVMHYTNSTASNGTYVAQAIRGRLGATPGDRRLSSFVLPLDLTPAGERTVDGRTYRVLTASGTDAFKDGYETSGFPFDRDEVTDLDATVLVDERGIVTSFRATYEYPDGTLNATVTVDAVGSTTVEEPDWLSEACEQTRFEDDC